MTSTAPGDESELIRDLAREIQVIVHFGADELDIDWRGQAEIQDLAHDVGRLEGEERTGKFLRQVDAQLALVIGGRFVARLERDEDVRVGRADYTGVRVGKIDTGIGQADVIEDAIEVLGGNFLANGGLDLVAQLGRFLHAQTSLGADVELEFARINRGEKVLTEERNQRHAAKTAREKE